MAHFASIIVRSRRVLARNPVLRSFYSCTSQKSTHGAACLHCNSSPAHRHPAVFHTLPEKTATTPAIPHRNPIDTPASTAPAAHFKPLYRHCPTIPPPH